MNKQQLASKIWAGANELRGKVSASSYKDYMLGFIFYKYLSDKEEKYLKEKLYFDEKDLEGLIETDFDTVNNCQKNLGFFIEYKNLFSHWISNGTDFQIADVRTALSAFSRLIGANYKKVYRGIFDTLEKGLDNLGTGDAERSKALRKLTALINEIPMDGNQDYDVLGFVYEFLLKNFAANAGKAGEFYTPYQASLVMSEIIANHLKDRNEISIYDPTSGSGSLLINIGKSVSKHMSSPNKVKYYAQELIENTYNLTRMNLIMRDILPDNIIVRNGDTLSDDWPFFDDNDKENTYDPVFVDGCCSNPPYSQSWVNDGADTDVRFSDYGVAPKSRADYAFLLHNLYHLKPDGIMTIVMPHGVLFRGGDEGKIRKNLIEKNNIETIIGMPSNIFFGTGIPTIIMVLKKNRSSDDVLFVDASKGFVKDGNKNKLQAKDIRKIVDTVIQRKTIDKYSRVVTKQEIVNNDYRLNITKYVDSREKPETWDIYSTMFGGIPNYEINELEDYWKAFPSLKKELFEPLDIPFSNPINFSSNGIILNNKDVKGFIGKFASNFSNFHQFLVGELLRSPDKVIIEKEESVIAKYIYESLTDIPLIDYYDAYQILDEHWVKIALDLETIQAEGIKCITNVDANMVSKKNNKTKETYEIQDGWVGHILPFDLVQGVYFSSKKESLENKEASLSTLQNDKDSWLAMIEPDDKDEILKEDGDEIDSKKLNAVISKLKKEIKRGSEFEADSYEEIILKINDVNSKMRILKKEIKDENLDLETITKSKIEALDLHTAIGLLEKKWIDSLCDSMFELPIISINALSQKVNYLAGKYQETFTDVSKKISDSKTALSASIDCLDCDAYDSKGLHELKIMLEDSKHGKD